MSDFTSNLKVTGKVTIEINDEIVQVINNLVVSAGKAWIANKMHGTNADTYMTKMAIGTDATAAIVGDIELLAEISRDDFNIPPVVDTTDGITTITYVGYWGKGLPALAPGDLFFPINEAGIFNTDTPTPVMLARTVFAAPQNKTANDTMKITWVLTLQ